MFKTLKNLIRHVLRTESLWCLLIALGTTAAMEIHGAHRPRLEISVLAPKVETIQVFCDTGTGFNERSSSSVRVSDKYRANGAADLRLAGNCGRIRLDLGSNGSAIEILSASLHSAYGVRINVLENIRTGELHNGRFDGAKVNSLMFLSEGADPYVVLAGDFTKWTHYDLASHIIKLVCIFFVVFSLCVIMGIAGRRAPALFIIMLVAALVRGGYYLGSGLPIEADDLARVWPDEGTYFRYVNVLLESGLTQYFSNPLSIEVAPGNLLYLASLVNLFDGDLNLVRIFNLVVLSSLAIIFTFQITRRLFDYKTAIVASFLFAVYPELIVYAPTVLTEYLFITLLLGFIWLLLVIRQNVNADGIYWLVLIAAFVGVFAAVTRLVFLPVVVLVFTYALYLRFRTCEVRLSFAMLSLTALMVVALMPFFINGHKHTGNYMIATGSGAALWLGSRADTQGDEPPYRGKSYDTNLITKGASHISPEGDKLLKEAALRNIIENPSGYALLWVRKIGRLLVGNNYFWFFPNEKFSNWMIGKSYVSIFGKFFSLFIATGVVVFGLSYPLVGRKINDSVVFVFLTLLGLVVIYLPFLVNQRYGLPIFALSSAFAANVMLSLWRYKKTYKLGLPLLTIFIVLFISAGR